MIIYKIIRYEEIMSKKASNSSNSMETTPNIDSSLNKIYSFDKVMHSYSSLFCNRCFTYDCTDHCMYYPFILKKSEIIFNIFFGFILDPCSEPPLQNKNEQKLKKKMPCGNNCYLTMVIGVLFQNRVLIFFILTFRMKKLFRKLLIIK